MFHNIFLTNKFHPFNLIYTIACFYSLFRNISANNRLRQKPTA